MMYVHVQTSVGQVDQGQNISLFYGLSIKSTATPEKPLQEGL